MFNRYTLTGLLLILFLATGTFLLMQRGHTNAEPKTKYLVGASVPSKFAFSGATGWWQGATRETDMALFHKDQTDGCFTSVQYHIGTVDVAAELQKLSASQAGSGGSATAGAVIPMTLQTNSGAKSYDLHQFSLTSSGGQPLMQGLELGYLQLTGSYIKVEAHCNTAAQLPPTIPALQAIKFDATK